MNRCFVTLVVEVEHRLLGADHLVEGKAVLLQFFNQVLELPGEEELLVAHAGFRLLFFGGCFVFYAFYVFIGFNAFNLLGRLGGLDLGKQFLEPLVVGDQADVEIGGDFVEVGAVAREGTGFGIAALQVLLERDAPAAELVGDILDLDNALEQFAQPAGVEQRGAVGLFEQHAVGAEVEEDFGQVLVGLDIFLAFAAGHLIERRLGDVDIAVLNELRHLAVEEGEQQRADMRAVHVGVGHDDDLMVARLFEVEVVEADAGSDGGDHGADFVVGEHFVEPRLLDIDHFSLHGKNGLVLALAPLLGGAARGVALHNEEFGASRVAAGAVGQLAGQTAAFERALFPREIARLARRVARLGRHDRLVDDRAGHLRVFLEVGAELLVDDLLDNALHLAVAELGLGLPLELRIGNLDAEHAGDALADVVPADRLLVVLDQLVGLGVGVHRAGERRTEAGEVRAALDRVDVVGEGEDRFVVGLGVLHRDLDDDIVLLALEIDHVRVHRRLVAVEVLDKLQDAAVVFEHLHAAGGLLLERDLRAAVEEGELAQAGGKDVPLEAALVREDRHVRHEGDLRAGLGGFADGDQLGHLHAALEALVVDLAVALDLDLQPFGEGVDAGDADSVQAARNLVGVGIKLAAGM